MTEEAWNPWRITAIGMALVVIAALATGLVVARWTDPQPDRAAVRRPSPGASAPAPRPARVASTVATTPSKSAIEACNRYAASESDPAGAGRERIVEAVSAADGTLYGLNHDHKADGRYRAAYARCMRSRGYAS